MSGGNQLSCHIGSCSGIGKGSAQEGRSVGPTAVMQIALKSNFLDVAYCLLYGELPSQQQSSDWHGAVMREARAPRAAVDAMAALPRDAHPMSLLMTGVTALGALHPEQNPALAGQGVYAARSVQDAQIVRLLGAVPAIAAYAYHHALGLTPMLPNERLTYAENFLYMLDAGAGPGYRPHPAYSRAIDVMFTLHAEHEMNCSTAAVRHLASSGVDVYTAVTGAPQP
jgi:citrate synthase